MFSDIFELDENNKLIPIKEFTIVNKNDHMPKIPKTHSLIGYIYELKNIKNSKTYIGQTYQEVKDRFSQHFRSYKKKSKLTYISSAIKNYGSRNFKTSIVETIFSSKMSILLKLLDDRENYWIDKLDTVKKGYNMKGGMNPKPTKWYINIIEKRRKYKCDKCEWKAYTEDGLKVHNYKKHSGNMPFKCSICDKKFAYKSNLKKHMNSNVHNKELYLCDKCDYKTLKKHVLKIHLYKKHDGDIPFECHICKKEKNMHIYKTSKYEHLNRHIKRVHEKVKNFECTKCHKSFYSINVEKKYICDICDKICENKNIYQIHKKNHKKIKYYHCSACNPNKKFKDKSQYNIHVKRHHTSKEQAPYYCKECEFYGWLPSHIKRHKSTKKHMKLSNS